MIAESEYLARDAVGLAELVRKKEVTPNELLDAALARAAKVEPKIHSIVMPMHAIARRRAASSLEGAFAGVPFLVKDLHQGYAGVPLSSGNKALKKAHLGPHEHAEIVKRWLDTGVVIFGRTNTPEFGAKGITEPEAWGPTHNPWNLAHSPGGSSGGAAAAVAAGIVPMAGASDGGGSIRIPASATGLFGIKPGRGRTPWGPEQSEMLHGAAMNHVLTRSVRDSALMLDHSHGHELGGHFRIALPERAYADEVGRDPGKLRIAFSTRSPLGTEVDPEAVKAVEDAARLLASLGHDVEPGEPAIDGVRLAGDFLQMWFANMSVIVAEVRAQTGCGDEGFELDTLTMAAIGRGMSALQYLEGLKRWEEYGRRLAELHARYDVFMTPTTGGPAPEIGSVVTPPALQRVVYAALKLGGGRLINLAKSAIDNVARDSLKHVPFTQLANLTGVPAMSVPLHWCANGLPLGVQFVADHGGEGLLFRLAGQLEQARPWKERRAVL
ncbi:MAG: amidase family protein [Polyangiales bacterium]